MSEITLVIRHFHADRFEITDSCAHSTRYSVLQTAVSPIHGKIMIKIPAKDDFKRIIDRYSREIDILVQHRHKNIVVVYGMYEWVDVGRFRLCPVLEHVLGKNLEEVMNQDEYTPTDVYNWMHQTARALEYLHEDKTVHYDVKPGNLLVDLNRRHLKLCDFGSATDLKKGKLDRRTPHSPFYAPPESFHSKAFITNDQQVLSLDIYSLGVTTWQLLTKPRKTKPVKHRYSPLGIIQADRAVLDKQVLVYKSDLEIGNYVERMLSVNYEMRPKASDVLVFMKTKRDQARSTS